MLSSLIRPSASGASRTSRPKYRHAHSPVGMSVRERFALQTRCPWGDHALSTPSPTPLAASAIDSRDCRKQTSARCVRNQSPCLLTILPAHHLACCAASSCRPSAWTRPPCFPQTGGGARSTRPSRLPLAPPSPFEDRRRHQHPRRPLEIAPPPLEALPLCAVLWARAASWNERV